MTEKTAEKIAEEDKDGDDAIKLIVGALIRSTVKARLKGRREGAEDMRKRTAEIVRTYLLFNSQRAVSWHEVISAIDAILALPLDGNKP